MKIKIPEIKDIVGIFTPKPKYHNLFPVKVPKNGDYNYNYYVCDKCYKRYKIPATDDIDDYNISGCTK